MHPYLPCDDLWVITTHYNPAGYATRRENYARFAQPLIEAGIHLVTVECAFGAELFELTPSPAVIQVRGRDVMWMKERLLNLAITRLPPHVTKVVWVDADMIFTNPAWAQATSALLDKWPIVQPFEQVVLLDRDRSVPPGKVSAGFAYQQQPSTLLRSSGHGTSGFAWAAQRALVQRHLIYDAAIAGSGDILWVHAVTGRLDSAPARAITAATRRQSRFSLPRKLAGRFERFPWPRWLMDRRVRQIRAQLPHRTMAEPFLAHYQAWAAGWYADVRGRMTFTAGDALHLWHGSPARRRYGSRNEIIRRHAFNPHTDLCLNAEGVWEWASNKEALHREVAEYFHARREDDDAG
jgi:hypothetical protein